MAGSYFDNIPDYFTIFQFFFYTTLSLFIVLHLWLFLPESWELYVRRWKQPLLEIRDTILAFATADPEQRKIVTQEWSGSDMRFKVPSREWIGMWRSHNLILYSTHFGSCYRPISSEFVTYSDVIGWADAQNIRGTVSEVNLGYFIWGGLFFI